MMFDRRTLGITGILMVLIVLLMGTHLLSMNRPVDAHPGDPMSSEGYQGMLTIDPTVVETGRPFRLTLTLLQPDGITPLTEFEEVHTKLLHLILVSQDLTQFLHVHPDYQGDGVFVLDDVTLPASGNYAVFADFTPTNHTQQVVRLTLSTPDAETVVPMMAASPRETSVGPLKITFDIPDTLDALADTSIVFHVADAQTGEPINTLDAYLGAAGHLVIVDQSSQIYLHTHPLGHDTDSMSGMSGLDMSVPETYGPDIEFHTQFPTTGFYAMWLQVQYEGEVYTVPFAVEVSGMAEVTPETTESSPHG
jgi:hypothetical protein